jgi:hypothetical protein
MAPTRDYKETVVARIKRDRKFARALYSEAMSAQLGGETTEGLSMLRDWVHAEITFKELARRFWRTPTKEKSPYGRPPRKAEKPERRQRRGRGLFCARGTVVGSWSLMGGKVFCRMRRASPTSLCF